MYKRDQKLIKPVRKCRGTKSRRLFRKVKSTGTRALEMDAVCDKPFNAQMLRE